MSRVKKERGVLHVKLLGGFETHLATGAPVTLPTRKAQALLAYLAVRAGQAHARDKLATLLWADRGDAQARDSLRHTLVELRKVFPDGSPSLIGEGRTVALDPAAVDVDVVHFETLVKNATTSDLANAAEIYQGDFLEGFVLREAPFEEWLVAERERLRELVLGALRRLLDDQAKAGAGEPAIRTALQLLTLDATQEVAHRTLMRLYAQQGRRAAALRQYQTCVGVLQRELGTEPEAETRQLYQEIVRRRDEPAGPRTPTAATASATTLRPVALATEAGQAEMPLVGRSAELATLSDDAFDETRAGRGRVVAVVGEAGVGKSRLVAELARKAAEHNARVLIGRCYESEQILPFGPWVDALRLGQVVPQDPALLALEPAWRAELARLFPEIGPAELPAPNDGARRLFESVTQVVRLLATSQPVLLVLEDVHWADEMTVRLLAFLGRRIALDRVLLVITTREEELADADMLRGALGELRGESHFAELVLSPLSRDDTSRLVRILVVADSGSDAAARLEEHAWVASAGNPFVIVEMVRALREGLKLQEPASLTLPQRVREVIARRVERLNERSRHLLSVAAVIGREFDFTLLQRASGLSDREAAQGVEELVRRRMLHGVGEGFDFTHDRIREVVYGGLLQPRRKVLHGDVAVALEALSASSLDPPAAALGMHYRHAEVWEKAALYLRQAGLRAAARSALADARLWFDQAINILKTLPESQSTLEAAFELRLEMRAVLTQLAEGPRALELLREAEELAERLGDERRRSRVCAILAAAQTLVGDVDEAVTSGIRAWTIASAARDLEAQILGRLCLQQAHFFRGDYERVAELAMENLAALPAERAHEFFGQLAPASIYNRYWLSLSLSPLGRFKEAAEHAAEALSLAKPMHHAYSIGVSYLAAGTLYLWKGDWTSARLRLDKGISVLRAGNIAFLVPRMVASTAWALAQLGESSEAVDRVDEARQLRDGLVKQGMVGMLTQSSYFMGRACLLLGRFDEARRMSHFALESGRSAFGATADVRHLLGDIATHPDHFDPESGEAHYRQALALAEPRGMRPLVAHCHRGLGKLYVRTGKHKQAQEHLTTAAAMYREMEMDFWLQQARAEMSVLM